ncbi:MAG: SusC/RagA family TonB-linked outer membrane protein, partial [Mariniphaga sp.]|nr:SusC/RagA family TonB-linked outer membrane protein [Mariniphaga sp.]
MKNFLKELSLFSKRDIKKVMLMTKLTFFLSVFLVLQMSASVYSQTRLSVESKNKAVKEVLREIEKQSEFRFFYNEDFVNMKRRVGFNIENETIAEIMGKLFDPSKISYKIAENNLIVIIPDVSQQPQTVTGKVTSARGEPIPGVTVLVKGSPIGTITDIDGNYSFANIPEDATLVFSFVGLLTQEIEVKGSSTIHVTMQEDVIGVDEVVIVGYGSQRKANLTGAVSTVSLPQMEKRTVAQTSLALQGLVPGLTVTQRSGKPGGDGGTIRIRGNTTIGNNDPLVLIDGVESSINSIDPESIESISVLKDAASSAIYGNRAANGVILITTKRAVSGKAYVTYNSYVAKGEPTKVPKYVGAVDFMKYISIAKRAVGMTPEYSEEYIKEYEEGVARNDPNYPDVDWFDATATNNRLMTNQFVTVSLGTEKLKSMTQAGYISQNGITENTNYKRYTLRSNNDYQVLPKLAVTSDISLVYTDRKEPTKLGNGYNFVGRIPANQAAYLADGRYGPGWQGVNPVAYYKDGGIITNVAPSAILNMTATYNPIENIELQGQYALN